MAHKDSRRVCHWGRNECCRRVSLRNAKLPGRKVHHLPSLLQEGSVGSSITHALPVVTIPAGRSLK